MPDKVFIDTNLWIYLFLSSSAMDDKEKRAKIEILFLEESALATSTQVLGEISNVLIRKYIFNSKKISEHIKHILQIVELYVLDEDTIFKALTIVEKYGYSFYDSLVIASSMNAGCAVLYTEDMQNGQVIDGKLKIINPFK